MGFFDGLKAGFGVADQGALPAASKAMVPGGDWALAGGSPTSLFQTGSHSLMRGGKELLAAYRGNPTVRKVVGLIAQQCASPDLYLESARGSGRGKAKAMAYVAKGGMPDDAITEHPFFDFLWGGNPLMPGIQGMKLTALYYLLRGEAFWLLTPGEGRGEVYWSVVPPHWVTEIPGGGKDFFRLRLGGGSEIKVPADAMVWFRDPDVINPYARGAGVGDSLRDEIDTDEYAAGLLRSTFANKGLMEGILQVTDATRESLTAARLEFERHHRGSENSGKVMVIDGTTANFVPLSQAFNELKILELREFEKTLIEETFCVPPELFGKVSNSNRATIYHAQTIFAENVLIPYFRLFTLEVGLRVLPLFDKAKVLHFVSPSPADEETRIDLIKTAPHAFTANEIRKVAELPPEPWGDVRYMPLNLVEVPAGSGGQGRKALAASNPKGAIPDRTKGAELAITPDQYQAILDLYTPSELAAKLGPVWRDELTDLSARELAALGVSPDWAALNPLIEDHIRDFGLNRLKVPIGTSQTLANAAISAGVNNLESINSIARRLLDLGATEKAWRARLIARTEVVRSANVGRRASHKASGIPGLQKRWLSALSEVTRGSHAALHNKRVGMDELFEFNAALSPGVPGTAMVPGDTTSAAHSCNCQCTYTAFDPEHGKMWEFGSPEHVEYMKAFDSERASWEAKAEKIIADWYESVTERTLEILHVDRSALA